jgi:hypothetical protein
VATKGGDEGRGDCVGDGLARLDEQRVKPGSSDTCRGPKNLVRTG